MSLYEYLETIFDTLHRIPEIAFNENKTANVISTELIKNGFGVKKNFAGTTVLGTKKGLRKGPHLVFRADMDALSFQVNGEIIFSHACGHDANSTMVLAVSKLLTDKNINAGKLSLLFQPAEETLEGALLVLSSGALKDVDELIGIHLRPSEEAKLGEATPSLIHSAAAKIFVKIQGKETHAARPHKGLNTIELAIQTINSLSSIHFDSSIPHSIKVTDFHGGHGAYNTIPFESSFVLDIRSQTNDLIKKIEKTVRLVVPGIIKTLGGKTSIETFQTAPAAFYSKETFDITSKAILSVLGKVIPSINTPGSEDFHFYSTKGGINTAYIGLGANLKPGLHKLNMYFDHQVLEYGAIIMEKLVDLLL